MEHFGCRPGFRHREWNLGSWYYRTGIGILLEGSFNDLSLFWSPMVMLLVAVSVVIFLIVANGFTLEDCELWANDDRQCLENPNFMWLNCRSSCMRHAKDVDENCEKWAQEGECTNNPGYIQLHCPQSCNYALGWSKYMRNANEMVDLLPNDILNAKEESCLHPSSMLEMADLMVARLVVYFDGGATSLSYALSSSSPTEYLSVLGLTEASLYVLRLYDVIVQAKPDQKSINDRIQLIINEVYELIVASQYNSDILTRQLPHILSAILHVQQQIHQNDQYNSISVLCNQENVAEVSDFSQKLSSYVLSNVTPIAAIKKHPTELTNKGTSVILLNGVEMPYLGLGTWLMDEQTEDTVYAAIVEGYRHIDTAEAYWNEEAVGRAIKRAISDKVVTRSEMFIATKLSDGNSHGGYDNTMKFVEKQLNSMQLDYFDLYYLHSPFDPEPQKGSWMALEYLYQQKVIRSLGISNFDSNDLNRLIEYVSVKPHVLQNKVDIYHFGKQLDNQGDDVIGLAQSHGIFCLSYSPFSSYPFSMVPLEDPIVKYVGGKTNLTSAQLIVAWLMQQGIGILVRSTNVNKLKENIAVLNRNDAVLPAEIVTLMSSIKYLVNSPVVIN